MNSNQDKVYKRTFKAITESGTIALIKRAKQLKYGFKEHWFEVEEVTGQPHTRTANNYSEKKSYFDVILFYKL